MKSSILKEENLTIDFQIVLEKGDYAPVFEEELKKARKSTQLKGFRKGKTPLSLVKKMYGQGLLGDVVNKQLDEAVKDFLEENDIQTLGHPLLADGHEEPKMDPSQLEDFTFEFVVGREPKIDVESILEEGYEKFDLEVDDEKVEKRWEQLLKQDGETVSYEEVKADSNKVTFNVKELEGNGSNKVKGLESSFEVLVSSLAEVYKEKVMDQKVGFKFVADLRKLEDNIDEAFVKKFFLKLDEEEMDRELGDQFELEIVDITDIEPAEVDEAFFQKHFGEEATDEKAAKAKIRESLKKAFGTQIEAIFMRNFHKRVLEKLKPDFPESYLMRLAKDHSEKPIENEKEHLEAFKKQLTWSMLVRKLVDKWQIKVEAEDVKNEFRNKILGYFGGTAMDPSFIEEMVNRMMGEREQVDKVYEDVLFGKLTKRLIQEVPLVQERVSIEQLNKEIAKINEQDAVKTNSEEE